MCRYCLILILCVHGALAKNICTNTTSILLNCERGETLQINDANFGYLNCEYVEEKLKNETELDCVSNVTDLIRKSCANQENCQINTKLPELANLCPDLNRTFLSVNYICEELKTTNAVTTETPENKKITTTTTKPKAKYGCGLNTCRLYCAPGCQRTCFKTYISQCKESCIPFGCRCREGYYRDPLNLENCIKYEHCPQMGNDTNEVYSVNAAGCQKACGSSQKHVDTCLEICEQYGTCEAGYVCKEGYQRESCFLNIFKKQYNCVKTCNSYYWCV